MKKLLYIITCALAVCVMAGCEKESEGVTGITYYPVFTLEGDATCLVPVGSSFSEPGYSAVEGETDVTANVQISYADAGGAAVSGIDTSSPGMYTIYYSATNKDGFSASASRTVFVYDPSVTLSMAGTYNVDMEKTLYGTSTFASRAAGYGNTDKCVGITFTELCPGIYYVNDLFAGWYAQIRAYDAKKYSMYGYVCLNADNTFSLLYSHNNGWGDGLDWIKDASYDPETGVITYSLSYAGQIFINNITLVK